MSPFGYLAICFAAQGVEWTDRQTANYLLTLGPEQFSQRNLSLNSEARVAEFELTMRARFSVKKADNQVVIETTENRMRNAGRLGKG